MRCFNCNNEISETDRFCKHCGISLDYSEETVKLEDDELEIVKDEIVTDKPQSLTHNLDKTVSSDNIKKSAFSRLKKKIIVIACVFLALFLTLHIFREQVTAFIIDIFDVRFCCALPPERLESNKAPNPAGSDSIKTDIESIEKYLDSLIADSEEYTDVSTKFQELDYIVIFNNDKFIQKCS